MLRDGPLSRSRVEPGRRHFRSQHVGRRDPTLRPRDIPPGVNRKLAGKRPPTDTVRDGPRGLVASGSRDWRGRRWSDRRSPYRIGLMPFDESLLDSPMLVRALVIESLIEQGFAVRKGLIVAPDLRSKQHLRALHESAVAHQRERAKAGLAKHEPRLIKRLAAGGDLAVEEISPVLVPVVRDTEDELLFRWARLHWSIPTSAGYGRRLRFLVVDRANNRLMGIIGLADPVFALAARDLWIGWSQAERRKHLHQVMDAFVLGAIPPYSSLLVGKFVATLLTTEEIGAAYDARYRGKRSLISGTEHDDPLALVTTTSALGRSAVYNRLRFSGRTVGHSVGFTAGSGDFQFANGLYDLLTAYAIRYCKPTAKQSAWGTGFRNRREVIKKALGHLGLNEALIYHGVKREIFVFPRGTNTQACLTAGEPLVAHADTVQSLFDQFRARWLLPRAARNSGFRTFNPEAWRLWP